MSNKNPFATEIKEMITSVLVSNPLRCTVLQLSRDFHNLIGYPIPIKQLGFKTIEEYLRSIPDTVQVYGSGQTAEVDGVIKHKSAHINDMVTKQKSNIPPHKKFKKKTFNQIRQPRFHHTSNPQSYNYPVASCSRTNQTYSSPPSNSRYPSSNSQFPPSNSRFPPSNNHFLPLLPTPSPPVAEQASNRQIPSLLGLQVAPPVEQTAFHPLPGPLRAPAPAAARSLASFVPNKTEKQINNSLSKGLIEAQVEDEYTSRVSREIQNNLRKLMKQFSEGIWCSRLNREYRKQYGKSIPFESYNYRSLIEMCTNLPEIFHYLELNNDYLLFDVRYPLPNVKNNMGDSTDGDDNCDNVVDDLTKELNFLDVFELPVMPDDACYLGYCIPRYFPDKLKISDCFNVMIAEIYDLSKFWSVIATDDLTALMSSLMTFFLKNSNKYKMPELAITEGLYCVTLYAEEYHRAIIINSLPNNMREIRVLFVDYGTVGDVPYDALWYLPLEFAKQPTFAVRTRLSNIYPTTKYTLWPVEAIDRFREFVSEDLVAEITGIDVKEQILDIYLADVTNPQNIFYINDKLVDEGYAIYTDQEQKDNVLLDPNCLPKVQYLHLCPKFDEIEKGAAPNWEDLKYIILNKVAMHHYLPDCFHIKHKDNLDEVQEGFELSLKAINRSASTNLKNKSFDYSLFPAEIVDCLGPVADLESVKEYATKKRSFNLKAELSDSSAESISGAIFAHMDRPKEGAEDIGGAIPGSMNRLREELTAKPEQIVPNEEASDVEEICRSLSPLSTAPSDFLPTNPFLNVSTNPFCEAGELALKSTNPFLHSHDSSDVSSTTSTECEKCCKKGATSQLNGPIVTVSPNRTQPVPYPPSQFPIQMMMMPPNMCNMSGMPPNVYNCNNMNGFNINYLPNPYMMLDPRLFMNMNFSYAPVRPKNFNP